ncbi:hypothetical protein [Methylobacterium sp. J-090]|uniref:hypothetical protein n=1 Tax=Methylobacterium sp. J-090 TaxID=2836666 RepID=UPI001FBB5857|nr:hypothetical protein [Methylobacterium sp. J-090]MCJ2080766.1 hypothetical protein [Methylobacterium sp. J-090]
MTNEWSHLSDEELQAVIKRTMAEAIWPIFEETTREEITKKIAETMERMTGLEGNVEVIFDGLDKATGLATFTHVAKTAMGEAYLRRIAKIEMFQACGASIH